MSSAPSESRRSPVLDGITLLAMAFLVLPLLIVVVVSFNSTTSLSFPPDGFSLRWYEETLSSPALRRAFMNSLIVASAVAAVTFVLGTTAAFALTRISVRWRWPVALLFFLPITVPGLFIGVALLVWFDRLEMPLSLTTVGIAHFIYVLPYFMLLGRQAFDRLEPHLEEAAADLGAGPWTSFRRVVLPQVLPVLLGGAVLSFALSFDEFVITFFVTGSGSTVPLYIWSSLRRTVDPGINAVSTLLMLATIGAWVIALAVNLVIQRRRAGTFEVMLP